jgi:sugar/nucleoside kinase (ribokinase family)
VVEENRDFLLEIIPEYADIVFANEEEARSLLGADPEEAVSILAKNTEIAIVKMGAKGSWIQQGEDKVLVPAYSVNCIDSTGAGDLYASGFIYGLINGRSLAASGQIGTTLAARVIQYIGAKVHDDDWSEIFDTIEKMK